MESASQVMASMKPTRCRFVLGVRVKTSWPPRKLPQSWCILARSSWNILWSQDKKGVVTTGGVLTFEIGLSSGIEANAPSSLR